MAGVVTLCFLVNLVAFQATLAAPQEVYNSTYSVVSTNGSALVAQPILDAETLEVLNHLLLSKNISLENNGGKRPKGKYKIIVRKLFSDAENDQPDEAAQKIENEISSNETSSNPLQIEQIVISQNQTDNRRNTNKPKTQKVLITKKIITEEEYEDNSVKNKENSSEYEISLSANEASNASSHFDLKELLRAEEENTTVNSYFSSTKTGDTVNLQQNGAENNYPLSGKSNETNKDFVQVQVIHQSDDSQNFNLLSAKHNISTSTDNPIEKPQSSSTNSTSTQSGKDVTRNSLFYASRKLLHPDTNEASSIDDEDNARRADENDSLEVLGLHFNHPIRQQTTAPPYDEKDYYPFTTKRPDDDYLDTDNDSTTKETTTESFDTSKGLIESINIDTSDTEEDTKPPIDRDSGKYIVDPNDAGVAKRGFVIQNYFMPTNHIQTEGVDSLKDILNNILLTLSKYVKKNHVVPDQQISDPVKKNEDRDYGYLQKNQDIVYDNTRSENNQFYDLYSKQQNEVNHGNYYPDHQYHDHLKYLGLQQQNLGQKRVDYLNPQTVTNDIDRTTRLKAPKLNDGRRSLSLSSDDFSDIIMNSKDMLSLGPFVKKYLSQILIRVKAYVDIFDLSPKSRLEVCQKYLTAYVKKLEKSAPCLAGTLSEIEKEIQSEILTSYISRRYAM